MKHIVSITLFVFLLFPVCSHANDEWYLMSRHGSCIEIGSLERKVGDMNGVETPDDFIERMRNKGSLLC
jgi:hypothetical protein